MWWASDLSTALLGLDVKVERKSSEHRVGDASTGTRPEANFHTPVLFTHDWLDGEHLHINSSSEFLPHLADDSKISDFNEYDLH